MMRLDNANALAAYRSMCVADLEVLRRAFILDRDGATTEGLRDFCNGRLDAIALVLTEKGSPDGKDRDREQ